MNSINKHFAFLLMGAVLTILSALPAFATFPGKNGRIAFGRFDFTRASTLGRPSI